MYASNDPIKSVERRAKMKRKENVMCETKTRTPTMWTGTIGIFRVEAKTQSAEDEEQKIQLTLYIIAYVCSKPAEYGYTRSVCFIWFTLLAVSVHK